jgi:HK97 gp10 family phage protein
MPKLFRVDKLEVPDLDEVTTKVRRKVMRQAAKVVGLRARELAPDSGRKKPAARKLKKSIKWDTEDKGNVGVVKATARHAHLVHDGTRRHAIVARRAPFLVFDGYAGPVHVRAVSHPGTRAQPFLTKAAEQTRGEVERTLREGAEQALEEIAQGKT